MPSIKRITGIKELDRKFKEFTKAEQNQVIRKGLRDAAKVIQGAAKEIAPSVTGALRRSLKVRAAKRKRGHIRFLVQTGSKNFSGDTYYGGFLEFGIKNKDGSWKIEPVGFMRRAADIKGKEATAKAVETFKKEILRIATK